MKFEDYIGGTARKWERWCAGGVFLAALATYLLTVAPSASYWDCPEYILAAYRLEVGHPPGNPIWMLAANVAAQFAPAPEHVAIAVNITSGVFTALAAMLLFLTTAILLRAVYGRGREAITCIASATAALAFAWSDTVWFSAVEAEVYAFSIFLTALTLWVALVAARHWREGRRGAAIRWLVLDAYVLGVALGVHQLNLLIIPALMLVALFALRRRVGAWTIAGWLLLGFAAVGLLLFGYLPLLLAGAEATELFCANTLGMGYHWGVVIFLALLGALLGCGAAWLPLRWARVGCLCIILITIGFGSFAVVYIRGVANPTVNTGSVSSIFGLDTYMGREQYGSGAPLLYGRSMHSKRLLAEEPNPDDPANPGYPRYVLDKKGRQYAVSRPGQIPDPSARLDAADSATYAHPGRGYVVRGYSLDYRYTPELDMVFPRMHSSSPDHISSYYAWTTMTEDDLVEVEITEAVDTAGRYVAKMKDGRRQKAYGKRPSYRHTLEFFGFYQVGYMYGRYLLWNFLGRQNDVPSQGQADAGNFITGIGAVDDLMLGPQGKLPPELGRDNPGRNLYAGVPLLLGILGAAAQLGSRRRGRRAFCVVFTLFVMTGAAIVVYLNQTPGEIRDRDYSFMGSIYAYCIWIGFGIRLVWHWCRRMRGGWRLAIPAAVGAGTVAWMCAVNWHDHDRSGQYAARDFGINTLEAASDRFPIIFTDGDNFTFPLWYAQEVEGARRDARVVSIAYLNGAPYIRQMLTPTEGSPALPLTGRAEDYDLGAMNHVKFSTLNRTPLDAVETLERYYSERRAGRQATIPSAVLRVAPAQPGGDSIMVDLARISPGKQTLSQRNLFMLDVLATNAAAGWPRDIYWAASLEENKRLMLDRYQRRVGNLLLMTDGTVRDGDPALLNYELMTGKYRFGGMDTERRIYVDPVTRDMASRERIAMSRTALDLLERGDTARAVRLADTALRGIPGRNVYFLTTNVDHLPFNSAVELAKVYAAAGRRGEARELLRREMESAARYRDYVATVPDSRRGALSYRIAFVAETWFYPCRVWLDLGFPAQEVDKYTREREREARNYDLVISQRFLIGDARRAAQSRLSSPLDSLTRRALARFYELGGSRADLLRYREFDDFPFDLYEPR